MQDEHEFLSEYGGAETSDSAHMLSGKSNSGEWRGCKCAAPLAR